MEISTCEDHDHDHYHPLEDHDHPLEDQDGRVRNDMMMSWEEMQLRSGNVSFHTKKVCLK